MHELDRHELNADWVLPGAYGKDRMVLLPRDPHWLFVYWEATPVAAQNLSDIYGASWHSGQTVLRVSDEDTGSHSLVEIKVDTDNWHIQVDNPGHSYRVELGRILPDGQFAAMLCSNSVRTPRDSISSVLDPHWKMFAFWQHKFYRRMLIGLSSYELFDQGSGLGVKEVQRD